MHKYYSVYIKYMEHEYILHEKIFKILNLVCG